MLRPELLPAPALALGLTGAALGHVEAVAGGLVLAAAAIGGQRLHGRGVRRLVERIGRALGQRDTAQFEALVDALRSESAIPWAGLVAWQERELTGRVVFASGDGEHALGQTALASWLIRDSETAAELMIDGPRVAVPLIDRDSTVGYVVLVFQASPSRRIRDALAALQPELSRSLAVDVSSTGAEGLAVAI